MFAKKEFVLDGNKYLVKTFLMIFLFLTVYEIPVHENLILESLDAISIK